MLIYFIHFKCCSSVTKSCLTLVTPWTAACLASLSFTISWSLFKLMSIESVMPSNYRILCNLLLLLPLIFYTIKIFSDELVPCTRWAKYWSFNFNSNLFNEYSDLNFFVFAAAAAAASLHSCPTLCDPIDGSLPGFPVPGILQARTLQWVAISFSNAWKWKVKVQSLSRVRL